MADFLARLWSVIETNFVTVSTTPLTTAIPIVLLTLAAYLTLRVAMMILKISFRKSGDLHDLTVVPGPEDGNFVFMNKGTMNSIFGEGVRPEFVVLKGDGRKFRSELRMRKAGGQDSLRDLEIEVTDELRRGLFPKDPTLLNRQPTLKRLSIREYAAKGLEGYWFQTNRQQRFQNRFAVYLSIGLLVLQLVIDFGIKR